MGVTVGVMIVVFVMVLARLIGWMRVLNSQVARIAVLMGMHMKGSNEQKHCQEAAEHPANDLVDRT